jgi:hypothetical protein
MRRSILAFTIVSLFGIGSAGAEIRTNTAGQVSVDIPSSWIISDTGKGQTAAQKKAAAGLLVAKSKDDAVGLIFWVVDKSDATQAIKLLDKALEGKVKDIKWENKKPLAANINGMKGIKNAGTAMIEGKEAIVMVAVVGPTPTKKGVIIFGAIDKAKVTEHKAELINIFDSLKPIKK